LKEKIYNAFGLNHLDVNGDHRITFEEAIDQFPKEWRSPEMDEILKQEFDLVDTNKSGDVDIDEFIAYWRLTVEPMLDAYESGSFAGYSSPAGGEYGYSEPATGEWSSDYEQGSW
jgi:hypothetical protein